MNGGFVDLPEEMGVSQQFVNDIVDELNEDDSSWLAWWEEHNLPQGLQLAEVHMHPTTREYVEELWQRVGFTPEDEAARQKTLVICELLVDSMIS